MSSNAKISLWLIPLFLLALCSLVVQAQDSMSQSNSVTGCLQKGVEAGGFMLAGDDGKMWELSGKIDATHVGHKITVTGHVLNRTKIEEAKFADNESQEANGKSVADFKVTSLKMIGDSCK